MGFSLNLPNVFHRKEEEHTGNFQFDPAHIPEEIAGLLATAFAQTEISPNAENAYAYILNYLGATAVEDCGGKPIDMSEAMRQIMVNGGIPYADGWVNLMRDWFGEGVRAKGIYSPAEETFVINMQDLAAQVVLEDPYVCAAVTALTRDGRPRLSFAELSGEEQAVAINEIEKLINSGGSLNPSDIVREISKSEENRTLARAGKFRPRQLQLRKCDKNDKYWRT